MLKCGVCGKPFEVLDEDILAIAGEEAIVKCPHCGKEFSVPGEKSHADR